MAPVLDEFGREIPDALMQPPDGYNDDDVADIHRNLSVDGDKDMDGRNVQGEDETRGGSIGRYGHGGGAGSRRYSRSRSREFGRDRGRSRSRSRGQSRSRSRSSDRRRLRGRNRDDDRSRDRDSNSYGDRRRGRGRSPIGGRTSRSRSPIFRKDSRDRYARPRSRSYSASDYGRGSSRSRGDSRLRSYSQSHRRDRRKPDGSERKARKSHRSLNYADDYMLCQFLWEKEQDYGPNDLKEEGGTSVDIDDSANRAIADAQDTTMKLNEDDTNVINDDTNKQSNEGNENDDPNANNNLTNGNEKDVEQNLKSQATLDEEYKAYKKSYCLKYVRNFFNKHLDDTWFRERYSPLEYRRVVEQNRERASYEASCVVNEVDKSCQEMVAENDENSVPSFVVHARLGGGTRPNSSDPSRDRDGHGNGVNNRKRKYSTSSDTPHFDAAEASGLPKSHLLSFLQENTAMHIMDVPSFVSDEHLLLALKEHAGGDASLFPLQIFSSGVVPGVCSAISETNNNVQIDDAGGSDSKNNDSYQRSAVAIFESQTAKDKLIENLTGAYLESESGRHARDSRFVPKVIELSVDCSDPYGRYEIDTDGKGGAPASSGTENMLGTDAVCDVGDHEHTPRVPIQRVSIFVSSSSPLETQTATVLSAAVSSITRINGDKEAAMTIARKLDELKEIPKEVRLDSILRKLFNSGSGCHEDMLDVSIAYLRRVHLFTFYNGCASATTVGDCLTLNHPNSVIHLRLKGADEFLQKAKEEHADMYDDLSIDGNNEESSKKSNVKEENQGEETNQNEPKDMLVMRLDDSIAKILAALPSDTDIGSPFIVNETVDAVASEIESLEVKAKREWIDSHTMVDGDGRARCSFHFCRKLFKDDTFLKKHLMKKHGEYVRAEMAKSHDSYMMKWWDEEAIRPVPQILVDCGSRFGLVPEAVVGAAEPCAIDPEPDLWSEEQEKIRQAKEEEERYREQRAAASETVERNRRYSEGGDGDRGGGGGKNYVNTNFVDVDDMKDEKVQLSFSNVDTAPPPKKKKRKKKKLL